MRKSAKLLRSSLLLQLVELRQGFEGHELVCGEGFELPDQGIRLGGEQRELGAASAASAVASLHSRQPAV